MINILYKGEKIYQNLSHEEVAKILDKLSDQYYNNGEYNPNEIELEEILNGKTTESERRSN
jgi:hypothetical protein